MARVTRTDLLSVLELLHDLGGARSADPFPIAVIDRLASLVEATSAGYCEVLMDDCSGYYIRTQPEPSWFAETFGAWMWQNPIHCKLHCTSTRPVPVSDFFTWRQFERLELYQYVCKPQGGRGYTILYLPSAADTARYFFFDHHRWRLTERQHVLLELVRAHFAQWRARWRPAEDAAVAGLTPREREVLEAVAAGRTNGEIARQLWISPHTVRSHLEHIYEKAGVHTRTAAANLIRPA